MLSRTLEETKTVILLKNFLSFGFHDFINLSTKFF